MSWLVNLPPPSRTPLRNSRPYDQGLLCNRWFPLVRPASEPLFLRGVCWKGVGWLAIIILSKLRDKHKGQWKKDVAINRKDPIVTIRHIHYKFCGHSTTRCSSSSEFYCVLLLYLCSGRISIFCCCAGEFLLLQHANVDPPWTGLENNPYPSQLFPAKSMSLCLRFNNPSVHRYQLMIWSNYVFRVDVFLSEIFPNWKITEKRHQQTDINRFFGSVSLGHQGTYQLSSFLSFLSHKVYSTASGTCWLLDQDATLHMKIAMGFPETKGDKDIWNHMEIIWNQKYEDLRFVWCHLFGDTVLLTESIFEPFCKLQPTLRQSM